MFLQRMTSKGRRRYLKIYMVALDNVRPGKRKISCSSLNKQKTILKQVVLAGSGDRSAATSCGIRPGKC